MLLVETSGEDDIVVPMNRESDRVGSEVARGDGEGGEANQPGFASDSTKTKRKGAETKRKKGFDFLFSLFFVFSFFSVSSPFHCLFSLFCTFFSHFSILSLFFIYSCSFFLFFRLFSKSKI